MKQKITIRIGAKLSCEKCRPKAMKIAVVKHGVVSVDFKGGNSDQMVIIGDGVDAVCMARSLRKKLGYAELVSVEPITEKKAAEKKIEPKEEKKSEHANATPCMRAQTCCCHHPQLEFYIHDSPTSTSICTIL